MVQGGDSNKRWTLKWTRLLCHSLSASLNLRSGFLQIGLLLKWILWIFFPAQIVSGCKEWPECDCWIYVFRLKHFERHDYPYYYDKFDDRILRILGAEFCSFGCSCVLTDFKFGIFHGRDCFKVFESDVKDNWDEVACCQIKGSQRNTILTGPLYSRGKSQRRNGISDDKVLTIALRYTAASVFRTADSLTPFRDSISAF